MDSIYLIAGTVFLLFLLKIASVLYECHVIRRKLSKLPSPPSYPFIGSLMAPLRLTKEERIKWFRNLSFQFKDGLFLFWVGTEPSVHMRDPKHVQAILTSNVNISKGSVYNYILPWLGSGLVTSTGEKWFHDRKVLTPTFHFNILENFAITMWEKAQILSDVIEKQVKEHPGQPIDIFQPVLRCALDIICETAMGINFHAQDTDKETEYPKAVRRFSGMLTHRLFRPWLKSNFIFKLTPLGRSYDSTLKLLHDFTGDVITKRKQSRKNKMQNGFTDHENNEDDIGRHKRKAFLDLMLDVLESGENNMTDKELREQVNTFLFAGHDTTAAATSWSLFCLGNYPEIQAKVQAEIDEVLGDSCEPITMKQIQQLKYMDRVIKECLRLFPSVPGFSRKLVEDVELEECTIPKGVIVSINPLVVHIDPKYWPDPMKFDPDRFLPENCKNRNPYCFLPFSAGPRNCIGQKFANTEEKILLASILRKWNIKSVDNFDTVKYFASIILRPTDGIFVHMTPRS